MSIALHVSFQARVIPWSDTSQDDARFQRILRILLTCTTLACAVLLLYQVPVPQRLSVQTPPLRLVTILLDDRQKPPNHVQTKEVANNPQPQPRSSTIPEPQRAIASNHAAKVPQARVPVPDQSAGERDAARRKAAGVGLLAMSSTLAEMQGAPAAVQLAPVRPGPGVGSGIGVGVGAGQEAGTPSRALITSAATGGSGGINTATYSRNTGGGGLAGRATTLVEGAAGGGGGGGAGGGGVRGRDGSNTGAGGAGGTIQRSNSAKASRSIEDIKLVFERNKGAIYAIYNRALREEPGLQGKVVVELKIAPTGQVLECRIVSSELKTPDLESKLIARIRQFDFGSKDVEQMNVTWPVDFLPS